MSFQERLNNVLKTGILPDHSFADKRDIIFTNKAAFALTVASLLVTASYLSFGYFYGAIFPLLVAVLLNVAYILQHFGQKFLAKLLVWFIPVFGSILVALCFGTKGNTHFYIIGMLATSVIFFKKPIWQLFLVLLHILLFVGVASYSAHHPPLILGNDSVELGWVNAGIMLLSLSVLIIEFQRHNLRYESKIGQLMGSVEKHSATLELQKSHIEKQAQELLVSNQILKKEAKEKEAAQLQLIASNEELKQYAYVASHDLKEPLRTVASFTQLIQRKHKDQFDEASNEYFQFVVEAVTRMSQLLDDLLEFSRLNRSFETIETDLNELLVLVKHNLKHQLEKTGGSIFASHMPVLQLNRQQFSQLFQNLISNSLKFCRDQPPIVHIRYQELETEHQFFIKDNGIGIPEEYREKIFVLFQRLHNRTEYEGSGIGLTVCRKVVQNHGGKIWLEPSNGQGTTIGFSISKQNLSAALDAFGQSAINRAFST
ncbi:MAG: GHKL domain-containing protein [Bacteroidetes bacterium]|nr:GHKL domain-containing protein [Bacteroidota bacterium]